jgi:hypothetical protein
MTRRLRIFADQRNEKSALIRSLRVIRSLPSLVNRTF